MLFHSLEQKRVRLAGPLRCYSYLAFVLTMRFSEYGKALEVSLLVAFLSLL